MPQKVSKQTNKSRDVRSDFLSRGSGNTGQAMQKPQTEDLGYCIQHTPYSRVAKVTGSRVSWLTGMASWRLQGYSLKGWKGSWLERM